MGTKILARENNDSPYFQRFQKERYDIGVHKNTKIFHTLAQS
jgi:hypothetical protein